MATLLVFISALAGTVLLGSTLGPAQTLPPGSLATVVKEAKWQKRVLLLCAPTPNDSELRQQKQLLGPVKADLNSRDLLVREVIWSQLPAADQRYLSRELGVGSSTFQVVLIGKDGGVKRRETQALPPAQLFSTIDAMPMRRQEMKRPR
ncbi:hypothetical protein HNQ93_000231 [Hymenobacter luteus]|uniref:DUF4174 domain-containing protein n=2 Tax=Hymenobacter TaxID=89966 RepID=A0A7W9SXA1_9BACT|nr:MULTISPECIES: DUF4174 domain-containing protein [Hymenobacter]MBB4600289.1 hypothetical protein [Hymenobacter latericoloratus]MBB6057401.1 hypothetical protein [Hymenobacter luteus]